ncbi:hypothetical protein D5S17_04105 [Pseudonocardiaceae bacterium YIM PH 21723]|nr:hypothetical protein D5S17_04105 [Pseudonocardiaceae bacterium YIM PH 21723]
MSIKSIVARGATVTAALAVAVLVLPATANAATSKGSCSDDGYFANYEIEYHSASNYDYPDTYKWQLGSSGKLGNQSNVEARIKIDKFGNDPTYDTFISGDNIKPGRGSHVVSNKPAIKFGDDWYAEFKFVFDRPNGGDPSCDGHTKNV